MKKSLENTTFFSKLKYVFFSPQKLFLATQKEKFLESIKFSTGVILFPVLGLICLGWFILSISFIDCVDESGGLTSCPHIWLQPLLIILIFALVSFSFGFILAASIYLLTQFIQRGTYADTYHIVSCALPPLILFFPSIGMMLLFSHFFIGFFFLAIMIFWTCLLLVTGLSTTHHISRLKAFFLLFLAAVLLAIVFFLLPTGLRFFIRSL